MKAQTADYSAVLTSKLSRTYGDGELAVHALDGVDLEIPSGQFVVLLGPSGSGKTTLLNLVGGIEQASSGEVEVAGKNLAGMDRGALQEFRRLHVAFIFQFFNLLPTLTALENVSLMAELTGGNADQAAAALDVVGLHDHYDRYPSELSGGEQQRVAIARALIKNSELLLCDEPTGALDQATGRQVLRVLRDLNRSNGKTIILVTHDLSIAPIADRTLTMRDGQIVSDSRNENPTEPEDLDK